MHCDESVLMNNITKKTVNLSLVALFLGGGLAIPFSATAVVAEAAPSTTQVNICKRVKVPQRDPWYLCINTLSDPSWSQNHPGCFATYKVVCTPA